MQIHALLCSISVQENWTGWNILVHIGCASTASTGSLHSGYCSPNIKHASCKKNNIKHAISKKQITQGLWWVSNPNKEFLFVCPFIYFLGYIWNTGIKTKKKGGNTIINRRVHKTNEWKNTIPMYQSHISNPFPCFQFLQNYFDIPSM